MKFFMRLRKQHQTGWCAIDQHDEAHILRMFRYRDEQQASGDTDAYERAVEQIAVYREIDAQKVTELEQVYSSRIIAKDD